MNGWLLFPPGIFGNPAMTPSPSEQASAPRKVVVRATRPALTDLGSRGDAWLVGEGAVAAVCRGDRRLGQLAVTPLDLPSLNRALWQVRLGQARRNLSSRKRPLAAEARGSAEFV
jgi:hypothetical protein